VRLIYVPFAFGVICSKPRAKTSKLVLRTKSPWHSIVDLLSHRSVHEWGWWRFGLVCVLFSPRLLHQIVFRSNLDCLHAAVWVVTHGGGFYDLWYAFSGLYCMEIFGECFAWRLPDWAFHHMWITTPRGFRRLGFWSDGAICGEEPDGHRIKKSIQVDVSSLILLTWFSSQGFSIPAASCSCSSLSSYVFQNSPYSIENST